MPRAQVVNPRDLVGLLGAFGIQRIVTSSATRCVDSIVPYARAIGVKPQTSKWLSEEGYTAAPHWLPSVVAETLEQAQAAMALVRVAYDVLPAVTDPVSARSADAPVLHPDRKDGNLLKHIKVRHGDIEQGFAEADVIVERTWGSTYSLSLLSATLSAKRRRAVLWPQPLIVGICSIVRPRFAAYFSA